MRVRFLTLFILFSRILAAQEFVRNDSISLSLKTGINRLDFFSGVELTYLKNRLTFLVAIETGVNRTFFQRRFFPRASVGFGFSFKKEYVELQPILVFSQSFLNLTGQPSSLHHWTEANVGYRFSVGKKWKFVHEAMGGWMIERYSSVSISGNSKISTLGYYGSVGFARLVR